MIIPSMQGTNNCRVVNITFSCYHGYKWEVNDVMAYWIYSWINANSQYWCWLYSDKWCLPACVQNLMCFTPTVIMWSGTAGFHCSMNILSLWPRVSASLHPFRQSQTTMEWSSSSPTEANFFPSPLNQNTKWK